MNHGPKHALLFGGTVALAVGLTACGAVRLVSPAEALLKPKNLRFEEGTYAGKLPNGWAIGRGHGTPEDYSFRLDEDVKHGGRASLMITYKARRLRRHGGMNQCINGEDVAGRVRFTGYIKSSNVTGDGASLWIQALDNDGTSVAFQNMDGRRVRGTADWAEHAVEIDVERAARLICFGSFLGGPGTAWFDDHALTVPKGRER